MRNASPIRWSGTAALAGGALWTASLLLHAAKPVGCVAQQCASRPMREGGPVEGALLAAALLGMALGAGGVLKLVRGAEGSRRATTWAIRLVAGGGAAVVLLGVTQAAFFDGDLGPMPFLVIPAGIALLAGFLTLGVAVLRSRVLPTPVSVIFVIATLLMAGFNEQTHAVLLGLPMGVAWIALGWTLWSGAARPDAAPAAS